MRVRAQRYQFLPFNLPEFLNFICNIKKKMVKIFRKLALTSPKREQELEILPKFSNYFSSQYIPSLSIFCHPCPLFMSLTKYHVHLPLGRMKKDSLGYKSLETWQQSLYCNRFARGSILRFTGFSSQNAVTKTRGRLDPCKIYRQHNRDVLHRKMSIMMS